MTTIQDKIRDLVFEAYDNAYHLYVSQKLVKKSYGEFQSLFLDCVNEVESQRESERKTKLDGADFLCKIGNTNGAVNSQPVVGAGTYPIQSPNCLICKSSECDGVNHKTINSK
jgi:hypothetical protein